MAAAGRGRAAGRGVVTLMGIVLPFPRAMRTTAVGCIVAGLRYAVVGCRCLLILPTCARELLGAKKAL